MGSCIFAGIPLPLNWQVDNKTYREQGSYRFTTVQRKSMELRCDIEIVSVVRDEYYSLKSNPRNGHFGYAVIFQGSSPIRRVDLEFPVTRIFQSRNTLATVYAGQWFITQRIAQGLQIHYDCLTPAIKNCLGLVIADPENIVLPGHPETIVKVKVPEGSQFNIIVYWVDIPGIGLTTLEIDPSDPGDGLDEYPEPSRNDPNDPWDGNPPVSEPDPANDPRDYPNGGALDPMRPVLLRVRVLAFSEGCVDYDEVLDVIAAYEPGTYTLEYGTPIDIEENCEGNNGFGKLFLRYPESGVLQLVIEGVMKAGCAILSVQST